MPKLRIQRTGWSPLLLALLVVLPSPVFLSAQAASLPVDPEHELREEIRELRQQVRELKSSVDQMRAETAQERAENGSFRKILDPPSAVEATAFHGSPSVPDPLLESSSLATETSANQEAPASSRGLDLARLKEEYELLAGKIDEQHQTKVESASKYRIRLSGLLLFNLFGNDGTPNDADVPTIARPDYSSGHSFGGSLRQSQIGFAITGPTFLGARTRADLQADFAGGFAYQWNGVTSGVFRLRTGTFNLDWKNTSLTLGQDALFFSPASPTSFASISMPALSYSGNLWSWTPQINVEHRIPLSDRSRLILQGGLLDPLTGEYPSQNTNRYSQAGEYSGAPAVASRTAWAEELFGQPLTIGVAGYYIRQDYDYGRLVDGWAGMADWNLPLSGKLSLSGEAYRGRAIAGIGGGLGRSVLFNGSGTANYYAAIRPLNAAGGWSQLKYRFNSSLETNIAYGQENSFARDVRAFPNAQSYADPTLLRNRGLMANLIWRPRSDLLFSAEYRHLNTTSLVQPTLPLDHLNLSMGVLF